MLDVELPKDVLAKGPAGLPQELIDMLEAELKASREQQRAVYLAELEAKAAAAAAKAGVPHHWTPPEDPEAAGYLADGDLSLYSDEMVARRKRLQQHPGVQEVIQAWWAWLPKDMVQVEVVVTVEEQLAALAEAEAAARRGSRSGRRSASPGPSNLGSGRRRRSSSSGRAVTPPTQLAPTTRTDLVKGLVKPVYCAMVVVVQLLLLPRYGLDPDPHYDPEDDWREDSKGGEGPMTYPAFFDAMFQLADMWVDSVVAWDYARLLADLLRDMQMHERESFLFSRVMQRFEYQPYYPEWLAEGPQFIPPKVLPDEKDEDAEAEWERKLEREEQRDYEAKMAGEDSEDLDEEGEEEEEEEEDGGEEDDEDVKPKPKKKKARRPAAKAKTAGAPKPPLPPQVHASPHPMAKVGFGGMTGLLPAAAAPHHETPSGRSSPSLWTSERRAKILASAALAGHSFGFVTKLLMSHQPSPLSASHIAAATGRVAPGHHAHTLPSAAAGHRSMLTGLQSMRFRFRAGEVNVPKPQKPAPAPIYLPSKPARGSLYKAPPAPARLRHRSPPGSRKLRPMPMLPLVPEDMYYILPRYVTYSDQLPDRTRRPHTAPEATQPPPATPAEARVGRERPGPTPQARGALPHLPHTLTTALSQPEPFASSPRGRAASHPSAGPGPASTPRWEQPSGTQGRPLSVSIPEPDQAYARAASSPGGTAAWDSSRGLVRSPHSSLSPSPWPTLQGALGPSQADCAARQRTWSRVGRTGCMASTAPAQLLAKLLSPDARGPPAAPSPHGEPAIPGSETPQPRMCTPQPGAAHSSEPHVNTWNQPLAAYLLQNGAPGPGLPMFYHRSSAPSREGTPVKKATRMPALSATT